MSEGDWGRIEGEFEEMCVMGVEVGVGRRVCEEKVVQYFCSGVRGVAALATLSRGRGVISVAILREFALGCLRGERGERGEKGSWGEVRNKFWEAGVHERSCLRCPRKISSRAHI